MRRLCHFISKVFSGAAVILMLAGLLLLVTPNRAMANTAVLPLKCTDASCGLCHVATNGDCDNTDGDKNGSCGSAGTGCAGCACGYVSTRAPCVCSK